MSSLNRLFLLFILLLIIFPALLGWKLVRGHRNRTILPALPRAPNDLGACAPSPFQAATGAHQEQPPPATSEPMIFPRDENDRWKALIRESEAVVDQYLVPKIDVDLAIFARCITFRVFAVVFLGVDPKKLEDSKLQLVTAALSDFYDDRQGRSALSPEVQHILYEWLPREQFPGSLCRILPAYEALWRIIATLVVTCEDAETRDLRWVMLDFRDNPRDRQFRTSFGAGGKSVSDITDDVVGRITSIARPPHASTSTWPLSCMHYARASNSTGYPPSVQEALKFAALLAATLIGRIGVQYGISGGITGSQDSPWNQRKIFEINRSTGHLPINELRPHSSRQEH